MLSPHSDTTSTTTVGPLATCPLTGCHAGFPAGLRRAVQASNLQRFINAYMELQGAVNCLFDSNQNKDASRSLPAGVKQRLEKKEGLFRKHMMVGGRCGHGPRRSVTDR